jgi:thymidylate synthase
MAGTLLECNDANDAYYNVLAELVNRGSVVHPRGMETRELTPFTLTIDQPEFNVINCPSRKLNYSFSVAEWLWILLGRNDVKSIAHYNKKIADYSDNGETFFGAYGPKLRPQLQYVVGALQSDRDSRQAVINIWREAPQPTKDFPCTIMFHFLLRNDRLNMITYMRSNDAHLGFPYDIFNFTQIQRYLAMLLGVDVGNYTHNVGSMHLYTTNREAVEQYRDEAWHRPAYKTSAITSPLPITFDQTFTILGSESVADYNRWANYDDCWKEFCDVLWYRRHRDVALLPEPYKTLVEAQRDAAR